MLERLESHLGDPAVRRDLVAHRVAGGDAATRSPAGKVTADAVTGGYRISGAKWLIDNATWGRVGAVLVRSHRAGGEMAAGRMSR